MKYTSERIERSRSAVRAQEKRVARQREMLDQAIAARHPADEFQARLLIMEQSLICMARFLGTLEKDLQSDLSLQKRQTQRRIRAAKKVAPAESGIVAIDPSVPEPVPFETIVKAMRKLDDR